jgi:hypothetical protein
MYHGERNPLKPIRRYGTEVVASAKGLRQRRLHKAFLRYHDAENWPLLREALKKMGRADLIGPSKKHLIPAWQPAGTGHRGGEGARTGRKHKDQTFLTTHAGAGRRPTSAEGAKSDAKTTQKQGSKAPSKGTFGGSKKRRG